MTEKPCEIQCFDKGVDLESKFGGWVRTHGGLIQQVLSLPLLHSWDMRAELGYFFNEYVEWEPFLVRNKIREERFSGSFN